jgi:hypothetical protein
MFLCHQGQARKTGMALSDFIPTELVCEPKDLVSLLAEPLLPASGIITASAGEWRLSGDGVWRFWQDLEWGDA